MIYTVFEMLGLSEPTPEVVALIISMVVCVGMFGVMLWAVRRQDAERQRAMNARLLTQVRYAYSRYKSLEKPVTDLLRPALLAFQDKMSRRDGVEYVNPTYTIGKDSVTLFVDQLEYVRPVHEIGKDSLIIAGEAKENRRRIEIPLYRFDTPYNINSVITDLVWGHMDRPELTTEVEDLVKALEVR